MKVLVTGACGNLGSHLRSVLDQQGFTYEVLTRSNSADIDSRIRGCDVVIHAAGDITSRLADSLVRLTESNLLLTARVLEGCAKHMVRRFFYISSCAVYGNSAVTRESGEYHPITINGKFKKLSEEVIEAYCSVHGISHTVYRLFNIYGGNDRFSIISQLKRCCVSGEPFKLLNDGLSVRDFVHVSDAAEIVCRCLTIADLPNVLNIGTGSTTSVREIIEAFKKLYPNLYLESVTAQEAEYSRADTTLLKQIVGDYKFRSVLDDLAKLEI